METTKLTDCLKVTSTNWDAEFRRMAEILFNEYLISANDHKYDIVEIEFYYNSTEHPDLFIYKGTTKNLITGNWFFHDSGIDLTFGDAEKQSRGGILIRALKKYEFQEGELPYCIGSWRTTKELLNRVLPISENGKLNLELVPKTPDKGVELTISNRMGLNKKKSGYDSKYRFIADIEKIKEQVKPSEFKKYYGEAYRQYE